MDSRVICSVVLDVGENRVPPGPLTPRVARAAAATRDAAQRPERRYAIAGGAWELRERRGRVARALDDISLRALGIGDLVGRSHARSLSRSPCGTCPRAGAD